MANDTSDQANEQPAKPIKEPFTSVEDYEGPSLEALLQTLRLQLAEAEEPEPGHLSIFPLLNAREVFLTTAGVAERLSRETDRWGEVAVFVRANDKSKSKVTKECLRILQAVIRAGGSAT